MWLPLQLKCDSPFGMINWWPEKWICFQLVTHQRNNNSVRGRVAGWWMGWTAGSQRSNGVSEWERERERDEGVGNCKTNTHVHTHKKMEMDLFVLEAANSGQTSLIPVSAGQVKNPDTWTSHSKRLKSSFHLVSLTGRTGEIFPLSHISTLWGRMFSLNWKLKCATWVETNKEKLEAHYFLYCDCDVTWRMYISLNMGLLGQLRKWSS